MAELKHIRCQGCGNLVPFYQGQGLFKCGTCGSIYEVLSDEAGTVRAVQIMGAGATGTGQPSTGEQYMPGGWQPPPPPGDSGVWPHVPPGYQPQAGFQGYEAGFQQPFPQYQMPVAQPMRAPGSGKAVEFLTFRRFLTPIIIQVIFWIGVVI